MNKLKLYLYPQAPGHLHDTFPEYVNSVPFSKIGIEKHCELVSPEEAEWFYMGQIHQNDSWMLHPNRWEYFAAKPDRHIVDIEGDWPNLEIPEFLAESVMTAMDAYPKHRYWKVYVRPGMSHLISDIIKRPFQGTDYAEKERKFVFMGQLDSFGLRLKMLRALELSGLPATVQVNRQWGARQSAGTDFVNRYEEAMRSHLFALVPCGEGISVRLIEACYYGCVPILIDNHAPFGHGYLDLSFMHWISADASEQEMARAFRNIFAESDPEWRGFAARDYFYNSLGRYFADPTATFLEWGQRRGIFA